MIGSRYHSAMCVNNKHLLVVISAHGYGHAAMTAPLVNALYALQPTLSVTIQSAVARPFLQRKFHMPFQHLSNETDFGMVNRDAFAVNMDASLQRYRDFHQDWAGRIKAETASLVKLNADALLTNIAYLPLAAAAQLGLPSVAFGCLNWAEIFHHHFPDQHEIYQQMLAAYRSADAFIRSEPAMPMAALDSETVGPIAERGRMRRHALLRSLGVPSQTKLVLATMGGIKTEMDVANWPRLDNVHYLIPDIASAQRDDISSLSTAEMDFIDMLRSADALLTKPGYGAFTEAAFNRTPVLYVERPDWPEHRYLCRWLERHLPSRAISRRQFSQGEFGAELSWLLRQPVHPQAPTAGLEQALAVLCRHLKIE